MTDHGEDERLTPSRRQRALEVESQTHTSRGRTTGEVDIESKRFPYCTVWTALPGITAFLPVVGHTGICTSDGVIHDFGGPYYVAVDSMTFGDPLKYWQMTPTPGSPESWDAAIEMTDAAFRQTTHNICCHNCHHHVADFLNRIHYEGRTNWTQLDVWWKVLIHGKYTSRKALVIVWGIFAAVITFVLAAGLLGGLL